jgi:hypothetical protein
MTESIGRRPRGRRGLKHEVVDRNANYAAGRMQYKLLDTGITGAPAAQAIGLAVIGSAVIY